MRRGVVCGARSGVEEALGTAGVIRGGTIAAVDFGAGTVNPGDGRGVGAGGRGRADGEAWIDGVDTAGAVARAVGDANAGVARAVGAGFGDAAIDGAGVETTTGVVRTVGAAVGDANLGVTCSVGGLGDAAKVGAGGVARAIGVTVGMADPVVFGVGTGLALAGAMVAVAIVVGVEVLEGRAGFTSVFEGASGGGVDSAFIFARARSPAERSVSVDQLFSTEV